MPTPLPNNPRLHELLADRATHGLSPAEEAELQQVAAAAGLAPSDIEYTEYDLAAGSYDLLLGRVEPMPAEVRDRLMLTADNFVRAELAREAPAPFQIGSPSAARAERPRIAFFPWIAAAASIALAVLAWWPRANSPGAGTSVVRADARQVEEFLNTTPDAVRLAWDDWAVEGAAPEISGVRGEVVWSDTKQAGFMHFKGLPHNDTSVQQYQLWIIDGTRGMQQRISGAIFDGSSGGGELYVPIDPKLTVRQAAAFAVTIEQPGGTWVSDMKRRVVIAAPKG